MAQTAEQLTTEARRLTAERGLTGYTVEELCDSVGISRRTFFNYFAAKEDAVLGLPVRRDHPDVEGRFLAAAREPAPDGLSVTLMQDLAELAAARWEASGISPAVAVELVAVVEREPRLLARMLELMRAQEQGDSALVEQREHLQPGDLRAVTAVQLIGALSRSSVEEFLTRPESEPFRAVLARRLAAARSVF